jgi:hypothetical protein
LSYTRALRAGLAAVPDNVNDLSAAQKYTLFIAGYASRRYKRPIPWNDQPGGVLRSFKKIKYQMGIL